MNKFRFQVFSSHSSLQIESSCQSLIHFSAISLNSYVYWPSRDRNRFTPFPYIFGCCCNRSLGWRIIYFSFLRDSNATTIFSEKTIEIDPTVNSIADCVCFPWPSNHLCLVQFIPIASIYGSDFSPKAMTAREEENHVHA